MQTFKTEKSFLRDKGSDDPFTSPYQRIRKRSSALTRREIPPNMDKENIDSIASNTEIPRNNLRKLARAASLSPADLPNPPLPSMHFGRFPRLPIEPQATGEMSIDDDIYRKKEATKLKLDIRSGKGTLLDSKREDTTFINRIMKEYGYNDLPKPYQSSVNNLVPTLTRSDTISNNRLALMAQLEKMRSEDEASNKELISLCDQLEQIRRNESSDNVNAIIENDQIKNTYAKVESTTLKKKSFFWKRLCQIILFVVLVAELVLLLIFRGLSEARQEFYIQKIAPDLQIQTQEVLGETIWEQMIRSARVTIIETMGWTPGWSDVRIPS